MTSSITFEGLTIALPLGTRMEIKGGTLQLHMCNATGTVVIARAADEATGARAEPAPPPSSGGRRPAAGKRTPDSAMQERTAKAVRRRVSRIPPKPLDRAELPPSAPPNGPLPPPSIDSDDFAPPADTDVKAAAPLEAQLTDPAWSDVISAVDDARPAPTAAAPVPAPSAGAPRAVLAPLGADTSLGAVAPTVWRWRKLELAAGGPCARWGHTAALASVPAADGSPVVQPTVLLFGGESLVGDGEGGVACADIWALPLGGGGGAASCAAGTLAWRRAGPDARSAPIWHSACVAPGADGAPTLLVMGGEEGAHDSRQPSNALVAFDAVHGTWFEPFVSGAPPSKRSGHSATIAPSSGAAGAGGSSMLVYGGTGPRRFAEPEMWAMDAATWKWRKLGCVGKPPFARTYHSATPISGGRLLVFGGNDEERSFGKGKVHVFHTDTHVWTHPDVSGELPAARTGHVAVPFGGRYVLVHGGWDYGSDGDSFDFREDVCVLDTETWVWSKVTCLAPPEGAPALRTGHVAVACGRSLGVHDDGCAGMSDELLRAEPMMLMHGGRSDGDEALADAWVLQPLLDADEEEPCGGSAPGAAEGAQQSQ